MVLDCQHTLKGGRCRKTVLSASFLLPVDSETTAHQEMRFCIRCLRVSANTCAVGTSAAKTCNRNSLPNELVLTLLLPAICLRQRTLLCGRDTKPARLRAAMRPAAFTALCLLLSAAAICGAAANNSVRQMAIAAPVRNHAPSTLLQVNPQSAG